MKTKLLLLLVLATLNSMAQKNSIDSLKTLLATAEGENRIKNLLELCWEYRFLNADTARQFGLQALELAQEANVASLEAQALHNLGITHEAQGNYGEALRYERVAMKLWTLLGDSTKIANTLNNTGIIYDEQGDYDRALENYFAALKIYERSHLKDKMAMVYLNIGIVLKAQGDFKKTAGYYRHALDMYQQLGDKFGIAACHANLGSVYFYLTNYDSSLYYSSMATREFEEQNIRQFLPAAFCNAGMAYDKMNKRKEAKEFLLKAQQLNEEYDNKKELSFVLAYLSKIHLAEKNLTEAKTTVFRALEIAREINAKQEIMEGQKQLSDIYLAQQNFQQALEEFRKYASVKDTLFKEEKSKQIAELQTKYETEKKENEITALRQENELNTAHLKFNQVVVVALIVLVLALFVLGYLINNRQTLKQKVELEETKAALRAVQLQAVITSQEEERRRFAADLHDGLGQLISAVRLNLSKEELEKRSIDQAVEVLNEMNNEIRNIAFNLMPQVLIKSGLKDALDELARRINRTGKLKVSVGVFDLQPFEETDRKVALYRICQEWINNVIKYSGCTQINLQLVQHAHELVITIEDNGQGFDPAILEKSQGNGWKNINSRLVIIQGLIEVDSSPQRTGTTAIITVPTSVAKAA